jgi:acetoin utilization deacetylase AcuC-like enzyme
VSAKDPASRAGRPLHAWASDHYELRLPPGHPFPAEKYRLLRERLLDTGVLDPRHVHASEPAPDAWLERVHGRPYVERVARGGLGRDEQLRLGLPWSEALITRARAAVYGTVMAARAALVHGIAGNLAGGTHHAYRERAEGYCLFNDIAVSIEMLRTEGAIRRPFVADLDVHQGNGTAAIYRDDADVFTFSMHAAANYPTPKERSSLDVELELHCTDDVFLEALEAHMPAALEAHAPDIVFYQAGVDGLREDRFGRLALTHAGLEARDRRVFEWCEARGVPVVIMLGGGYGRPIEATVEASAGLWRAARDARARRPAVDEESGAGAHPAAG